MVMMSSERANERQLTFCSASLDDNNVWPVWVGGEGESWDLCDILVRENGIIKYLFFIYDPLRRRTRQRGEEVCIQVLECRSRCIVAHYLHNNIILLTKEDGDKIITTTMSAALMSCSIIINNVWHDKASRIITSRVCCVCLFEFRLRRTK